MKKFLSLFVALLLCVTSQAFASGDRIRDTAIGVAAGTLAAQGVNAAVRAMTQPGYNQYAAPAYVQPSYNSGYYNSGYNNGYYQPQAGYYPQQPMYMPQPPMYAPQPRTQVIEHIVYDERPRESKNWWYYCRTSKAYYPYVKSCRTEWERVPATPQD